MQLQGANLKSAKLPPGSSRSGLLMSSLFCREAFFSGTILLCVLKIMMFDKILGVKALLLGVLPQDFLRPRQGANLQHANLEGWSKRPAEVGFVWRRQEKTCF